MKTKRIEIKRWVNWYPEFRNEDPMRYCSLHLTKEIARKCADPGKHAIQVELTGYVEVEERKVEITESELDQFWEEYKNDGNAYYGISMMEYMKRKLFGESK